MFSLLRYFCVKYYVNYFQQLIINFSFQLLTFILKIFIVKCVSVTTHWVFPLFCSSLLVMIWLSHSLHFCLLNLFLKNEVEIYFIYFYRCYICNELLTLMRLLVKLHDLTQRRHLTMGNVIIIFGILFYFRFYLFLHMPSGSDFIFSKL